jgi:hypothetical protein
MELGIECVGGAGGQHRQRGHHLVEGALLLDQSWLLHRSSLPAAAHDPRIPHSDDPTQYPPAA